LEAHVSEHISALARWALGWRKDLEALKAALSAEGASAELRRYAAAALSYVVSRMDLVPDWEPAVGMFDDLMVVRICAAQAVRPEKGVAGLDADTAAELQRLAGEAAGIEAFLGDELFARLRAYCDRQTGQEVRARTPNQLLTDGKARAQLYAEVDDAIARAGDVSVPDAAQAAVRLKAYLQHKLK
jgi:uncharacterized membrane protein YkvA (DUF1232 family)